MVPPMPPTSRSMRRLLGCARGRSEAEHVACVITRTSRRHMRPRWCSANTSRCAAARCKNWSYTVEVGLSLAPVENSSGTSKNGWTKCCNRWRADEAICAVWRQCGEWQHEAAMPHAGAKSRLRLRSKSLLMQRRERCCERRLFQAESVLLHSQHAVQPPVPSQGSPSAR